MEKAVCDVALTKESSLVRDIALGRYPAEFCKYNRLVTKYSRIVNYLLIPIIFSKQIETILGHFH